MITLIPPTLTMPIPPTPQSADVFAATDELIQSAYRLAAKYMTKERRGGGTMLGHCLHVATELAHAGMPTNMVIAGMLHDIVEDSEISVFYVTKEFGDDVGLLVDVLTKTGKGAKHNRRYLQRLELVGGKPAVIIKLVDNAHNLLGCRHVRRPHEYVKYGKKIQAIGCRVLGADNPFVLTHLKALRSAQANLVTLA